MAGAPHQFHVQAQFIRLIAQQFIQARVVQPQDQLPFLDPALVAGAEQVGGMGTQIENALETLAVADRPGHRRALDLEHRLHLVQDLDGVPTFPVQLVDKGQDRRIPQPAYFHQLDGAFLDALGGVDHHQG
jgi:hypothetical protein